MSLDQKTIAEYAARLEATGLQPMRAIQDPSFAGNRHQWVPVPWEAALLKFLANTGLTIREAVAQPELPRAPIRLLED